jgi:hypothetical protein
MAINCGPARPGGRVREAAAVAASRGLNRVVVRSAARGLQRTPAPGRGGLGKCRATATCVRVRPLCGPPDGKRGCRSTPACQPISGALHDTPAGRIKESIKNFCCVTTRRRNFWVIRGLRHRWGALTARTLRRGVLGFGCVVLAASGLPSRRLPATDQPPTFGVLTVTLVPTPWLVLVPTAFAQADSCPRSSRTGTAATFWTNMTATHGSSDPKGQPGENVAFVLLGRLTKPGSRRSFTQDTQPDRNQTGEETA